MKKAIIGSKSRSYDFTWRVSDDKQALKDNLKMLKLAGDSFSLTLKSTYGKKVKYVTTGIATKEDKNDFKNEQSAGFLTLAAFSKIMKKPETISINGHTIKENEIDNERPFVPGTDVTSKNWVLMFSSEDRDSSESGYWIGIIKNGIPWLMFFDKFVPENDSFKVQGDIVEELSSMITTTEDKSTEYTFISDRQDIIKRFEDHYFNHNSLKDKTFESIIVNFDTLIEGVKSPKLDVINTSIINPLYIAIALGLAGAGFGINYYMGYLDDQESLRASIQHSQDVEKSKIENLKLQAEYEKLKEKTLKDTLEEANNELNAKISAGNPYLTISAWLDEIYRLKINHNGWLLRDINCSIVSEKINCDLALQKGSFAFNKDLILNNPTIAINNDNASYNIKGENVIEYKKENYNTLPDSKYFLIETITLLQRMELAGVKYSTGELQEITKSVTLPEPPSKIIIQKMDVEPIKMGVSAGELKISGNGLYLLEGLKTWLSDPTLKIDTVKISVGVEGSTSWELTGNYFVKTADAPILPVIEPSTIAGINSGS